MAHAGRRPPGAPGPEGVRRGGADQGRAVAVALADGGLEVGVADAGRRGVAPAARDQEGRCWNGSEKAKKIQRTLVKTLLHHM